MSHFRFFRKSRMLLRTPRSSRPADAVMRVSLTLRIALGFKPHSAPPRRSISGLLGMVLTGAAVAIGLMALPTLARAQQTSYATDVTLRFRTADLVNPHGAALQSMWSANGSAGWGINYDLTTGWNTGLITFGSFTDIKTPDINMGLFTIPGIDFGEWGAGGKVFTKGADTGLRFGARVSGGNVDVDYPLHFHIETPKFIAPGAYFQIHVSYQGDPAASVSTYSPQVSANVNLLLNAQLLLNGRVELASHDLFNSDIIDWCDRTDPDSPKYFAGAQLSDNKGLHYNTELFNTDNLFSGVVQKFLTYQYPAAPRPPSIQAGLNLPFINTVGQPGSVSNYNGASGGSSQSSNTSYEYTYGITIPDSVSKNPNATYARGQDNLMTLTADFTNLLTNSLDQAGIPMPPLNYDASLGGAITISAGLLDLQANLGLGFLQEFGFVPRPHVTFTLPDGSSTQDVEIDPVNGTNVVLQMPPLPIGADPNTQVSMRLTPHITLHNDFISNTYLNFNGGVSFSPLYVEASAQNDKSGAGLGGFTFDPLQLAVGANVPVPIYKTTFEIPFDPQDGDAVYVQTQAPPLASLLKADPNLLYVNERDAINTGVSYLGIWLYTDPTPKPGNDFAAPWYGVINNGSSSATQLSYGTRAYWDKVADTNHLFWDGAVWADSAHTITYTQLAALFYSETNTRPDVSPGIHHIYTANTAKAPDTNLGPGSSFGPLITGLPINVAYPTPHIDELGVHAALTDPNAKQDQYDPQHLLYKPIPPVSYSLPSGQGATVGPIVAGSPGFTLLALDDTAFNPPNYTLDPLQPVPFAVGGFSRIKFDGKLLAPGTTTLDNNTGRPWVSGQVPASMLAVAGYHTVVVSNPTVGGMGGDSNVISLQVVNPVPILLDATAVQQNPVGGSNANLYSHTILAGRPDVQLQITGSGFIPGTLVFWNDTAHPLPISFVNSGLVYATLPAAFTKQPQAGHNLLIVNPRSTTGSEPIDGGLATTNVVQVVANKMAIGAVLAGGKPVNGLYLDTPTDLVVTVKGANFWPGAVAQLKGTNLPTTFVDEQTLTVTIPGNQPIKIGAVPLNVNNTDYTGQQYHSNDFTLQVVYAKPFLATDNVLPAVYPPAMQVGAAAPAITLTGGIFYPQSKVTIGGVPCTIASQDSRHLTVKVPASIAGGIGSYPIVVTNPTSTRGNSSTALGDGGPSNPMPFQVLKYAPIGQLTIQAVMTRLDPNTVQAQITLTDTGLADTTQMTISNATLGGAVGDHLPRTIPPIRVGQSTSLTMRFAIPSTAKGQIVTLALTGIEASASCSMSTRVIVP